MNEIIININEANKAQKYQNENELFQIEAFKRVSEILKEHKVGNDTTDITDCRFHDTIFIDGDRGVGKTAFMINIENYYKNLAKIESPKYIFLKPVDPTLLEHTEKFLSVVLARIVEYVNDNKSILNNSNLDNYFKSLENLSKSLEAIKTLDKDIGIEEIASNKSSLKLEQYAHVFFKEVCFIFGMDSIVMLIDDVDMAFDKGFDVLEVVRKYLASPYLIPIVAGDKKLYKEIIETRFKEKIEFFKDVKYLKDLTKDTESLQNNIEYKSKLELLNNLVEQYLHKVFPNENYIKLDNIFKILKNNYVTIKYNEEFKVSYNDIKDFEIRFLNFGINQVDFTYKVFTDNARDLVQYIYSKRKIYKDFFETLENYKFEKSNDIEISIENVSEKFDKHIINKIFAKTENFYTESLNKTALFYKFSNERKKRELSFLVQNDYDSFSNNEYSIYNAFNKDFFKNQNKLKLDKSSDKYALQSKSLESLFNDKDDFDNEIKNYIVNLFIFNNYYSSYQTRNYIFSGRFIESMIYSLDKKKFTNNLFDKNYIDSKNNYISLELKKMQTFNLEKFKKIYTETYKDYEDSTLYKKNQDFSIILRKTEKELKLLLTYIPFGSLNENNKFEKHHEKHDYKITSNYSFYKYAKLLLIWQSIHLNKDNYFNSVWLYEVLLKFFRNIEKIKEINFSNDKPIDTLKRIVLIFINSIAYFENTNTNISNTNFAMNERFNLDNILSKTPASLLNIMPMLKKEYSLTRAFLFHPIIRYILLVDDDSKLLKLEWQKNKGDITFNMFNNIYNSYFTPSGKYYVENYGINFIKYLSEIVDLFNYCSPDVLDEVREKFSKNKYDKIYNEIIIRKINEEEQFIIDEYKNIIYGE